MAETNPEVEGLVEAVHVPSEKALLYQALQQPPTVVINAARERALYAEITPQAIMRWQLVDRIRPILTTKPDLKESTLVFHSTPSNPTHFTDVQSFINVLISLADSVLNQALMIPRKPANDTDHVADLNDLGIDIPAWYFNDPRHLELRSRFNLFATMQARSDDFYGNTYRARTLEEPTVHEIRKQLTLNARVTVPQIMNFYKEVKSTHSVVRNVVRPDVKGLLANERWHPHGPLPQHGGLFDKFTYASKYRREYVTMNVLPDLRLDPLAPAEIINSAQISTTLNNPYEPIGRAPLNAEAASFLRDYLASLISPGDIVFTCRLSPNPSSFDLTAFTSVMFKCLFMYSADEVYSNITDDTAKTINARFQSLGSKDPRALDTWLNTFTRRSSGDEDPMRKHFPDVLPSRRFLTEFAADDKDDAVVEAISSSPIIDMLFNSIGSGKMISQKDLLNCRNLAKFIIRRIALFFAKFNLYCSANVYNHFRMRNNTYIPGTERRLEGVKFVTIDENSIYALVKYLSTHELVSTVPIIHHLDIASGFISSAIRINARYHAICDNLKRLIGNQSVDESAVMIQSIGGLTLFRNFFDDERNLGRPTNFRVVLAGLILTHRGSDFAQIYNLSHTFSDARLRRANIGSELTILRIVNPIKSDTIRDMMERKALYRNILSDEVPHLPDAIDMKTILTLKDARRFRVYLSENVYGFIIKGLFPIVIHGEVPSEIERYPFSEELVPGQRLDALTALKVPSIPVKYRHFHTDDYRSEDSLYEYFESTFIRWPSPSDHRTSVLDFEDFMRFINEMPLTWFASFDYEFVSVSDALA